MGLPALDLAAYSILAYLVKWRRKLFFQDSRARAESEKVLPYFVLSVLLFELIGKVTCV